MVEAMDAEIGRLLTSLDPAVRARTTVIFVADNGTTGDGLAREHTTPNVHEKGSVLVGVRHFHKAPTSRKNGNLHCSYVLWHSA